MYELIKNLPVGKPSKDNKYVYAYVAQFKVIINKYAEDMDPTSDVLAVRDILSSNLRYLPDSLVISPSTDSIEVLYDKDANTLTFLNVPDETRYEITYQVRVLGQGSVTYSNTIQFGKYEKQIEESTVIGSSGGGSASNPSITVVKRDAESLSSMLAGATFGLYYMQNGDQIAVIDNNGDPVTFTTGSDGTVLIAGNQQTLGWALWTDRTYCLVELVAPVGYVPNPEPTYFVLSETPSSQIEYDITGDRLDIQNTREKVSIPVTKVWVGPEAQSVTVYLLADGARVAEAVLNEEGQWQHTFADLDKYNNGIEIVYRIEELDLSGYASSIDYSEDGSCTITNTSTATIDIPVTKQWIGAPASAVTITLTADNTVIGTVVLSAEGEWKHTFTGLPKYDHTDGHEIVYDVTEEDVTGYSQARSGTVEAGFTFTNTNTATIDIPVTKQWIGEPANAVTINLTADNAVIDTVELNAEGEWKHTFTGLPKYDQADGHEIVYDVTEEDVAGYSQARSGTVETGFTFTNTISGKVSIPVTKVWIGPKAQSVTVYLLADGARIAEAVLIEEGQWQHTFADLDKYNNGIEIVYRIEELDLNDYASSIEYSEDGSCIIRNTSTATIDIPVMKQWIGEPASAVTINLTADNTVIDTVELNAEGEWKQDRKSVV